MNEDTKPSLRSLRSLSDFTECRDCREYIESISKYYQNDLDSISKDYQKEIAELKAKMNTKTKEAYQEFTTPLVVSSEPVPIVSSSEPVYLGCAPTETFLEVGKSYIFGLGKIVYYGKIKAINDNEIWITDVSVTILDKDYCGLTSSGMDIKEEIILLRNTLHRIAIKK